MTGGQCLCRTILIVYFVCIGCIFVFSDEESSINEKLSINSEEYERRRKIVNSYLSDYYESKKDWVETYHYNYAPRGAKDIKQISESESDNINEIKYKFTEQERENSDLELLKYEMNLVETFTDFFKNDSDLNLETSNLQNIKTLPNDPEVIVTENESSEPVETKIVKETHNIENVQTFDDVEIDQNIKPVISNMEVKNTKSNSFQPVEAKIVKETHIENVQTFDDVESLQSVETREILKELPNIEKVQALNGENIQLVINGKKVEIKRTDYLRLVEAGNILKQLRNLNEGQTFDDVVADQNIKTVLNDGEDKLTKNISPPPVKADKISNDPSKFGKVHAIGETIIEDKFPVHDELHKRRKLVNSYLSKFDSTDDWVETYVHNFQHNKAKHPSLHTLRSFPQKYDSDVEEEVKNLHDVDSSPYRFYISRWLNKLLNKFRDAEYKSITFSLDDETIENLKKVSENLDIVSIDEFFCSFISNSTVNHSSNWFSYIPSNRSVILLISVGIFVFIYMWYRPVIFFSFAIFFLCFGLQAYKRYETSIAKKQATVSSIPPTYCESFVTKNSGLIDIVKDYFRKSWYHEDCKKYYEAIMVNPINDINPPVVIMEILADTVFQFFRSLAHLCNYFIKELLYDTSFIHQVFIIIGLLFLLLIIILCFNYKIRLPYFLATLEPTFAPVGSRVQDLNNLGGLFSNTSSVCAQKDKNDVRLASAQKEKIEDVNETLPTKPIICMNIHKYICMKACQGEKTCSDKVASISESERQPNSYPQSPIESDENCISDPINSCDGKISEPSFQDNINNKLAVDKDKEIYNYEVVINSDESKRHSSSFSESPIKQCVCHPDGFSAEKVLDHIDVDRTILTSDESMCSESSHVSNIKPN